MSEPFLGEIKLVGFNFAPRGWAMCQGQLLPIDQNQSLFALLGTIYGGDGRTTFALPDLRGRLALHAGQGPGLSSRTQGSSGGAETVTLQTIEMPAHRHALGVASPIGNLTSPSENVPATSPLALGYAYGSDPNVPQVAMDSLDNAGGGQAHTNMQPYLALNYVIALQGIFPPRQ